MEVCAPDPEFHVTFDSTTSLRTLLEVLSAMFSRGVEFSIVRASGGTDCDACLKVEAIDASQCAIVKSSLRCRVVSLIGTPKFTVDTEILGKCLKSVAPHYSLDLFSAPASSNICLRLYETISRTHVVTFNVATMVNKNLIAPSLTDISFQFSLEFDATVLRNCIRSCRETEAQDVVFKISTPAENAAPTDATSNVRHMVVGISAEGQYVSQERLFHSIIDQQRGGGASTVIMTTHEHEVTWSDPSELCEKYSGRFSISYLSHFVKSIERHTVTARMERGKPLVLSYALGGDESYILLVLAEKMD